MGAKPTTREFKIWRKSIAKVKKRKFNPPVTGRVISPEERNRPLLDRLAAELKK